jgi:hypothetical protein
MSDCMSVGDPVEVHFYEFGDEGARNVWRPATCVVANGPMGSIGVAYADSRREMVEAIRWRKPDAED